MLRFVTLALLVCWYSHCSAQSELQRRPPVSAEYLLGPGDQIQLHVADIDEITDKPITLDPGGFIDLPMAGRVEAEGLTITRLKAILTDKLSRYVTSPAISINLSQTGSRPVSVVGEVNLPGVHQLTGSKRLLEVISLSGGIKADAGPKVIVTREPKWGSLSGPNARLESNGYSIATFSLDALLNASTPQNNILMMPDDTVSIPRAELVYVVGDVKKAGGFQLSTHDSVSLLQALSLAEGLGPDSAARRARILRPSLNGDGNPREIPVDVEKILAGKAPDIRLAANDVLFIPQSGAKVTVRRAIEAAIGVGTGLAVYR